jgi:low affinity Fe/Cu permease
MDKLFHKFAVKVSQLSGRPSSFTLAVGLIIIWLITGPIFGFSDTWQLVINTGTTIITFLMVFLIQNTQNRDSKSIHLKLDELIATKKNANNVFLDLDDLDDKQLDALEQHFITMHKKVIKFKQTIKK